MRKGKRNLSGVAGATWCCSCAGSSRVCLPTGVWSASAAARQRRLSVRFRGVSFSLSGSSVCTFADFAIVLNVVPDLNLLQHL